MDNKKIKTNKILKINQLGLDLGLEILKKNNLIISIPGRNITKIISSIDLRLFD